MAPRILVIDNYDSFVYNLVQYLGELGAEPEVHRDDALGLADVERIDPAGILISPGPGPRHRSVQQIIGPGLRVRVRGVPASVHR